MKNKKGMCIVRDFPTGIWPVMLTPFTEDNAVDYQALKNLTEWYINEGCDGLFAVCQSSEMFYLSLEEKKMITQAVKAAAGDVPVIASGHTSDSLEDQAEELIAVYEGGADALILVSNRLARQNESDDVLINNLKTLIGMLPSDIPLGFYECPYPYKRLITPNVLEFCADTGRFAFLKDTCCNTDEIAEKLKIIKGSGIKLYNANTATLLETLKIGADGYSGVMANFHTGLYKKLFNTFAAKPEAAEKLQEFLSMAALIENVDYPICAKYAQRLMGSSMSLVTRKEGAREMTYAEMLEVRQLVNMQKRYV